LIEDQRGLIVRYLPLAEGLARRMKAFLPAERDEIQSTAYLALVEAAHTFDPARDVKFATYARHRIRGAILDYRRFVLRAGWRGDKASFPVFQSLGAGSELHGWVIGKEPQPPVGTELEAKETVESWLRRLPPGYRTVCRLIYINGNSQEEAAAIMGCSKSFLSRLHREAISWLKWQCESADDSR
jgi:RNA polymerase sigma factor (sigma-70 family)